MENTLITFGCSFTEGVGCYDYTLGEISKYDSVNNTDKMGRFHAKNLNNFLLNGWPSKLQDSLCYDKLLNYGYGGSSNSYAIKRFVGNLYHKELKNSNVLVIWLLTFHHRFTYFYKGKLHTFTHGDPIHVEYNKLLDETDSRFESYHHVEVMKALCDSRGWNFLFASISDEEIDYLSTYPNFDKIKDNFINTKIPVGVGNVDNSKKSKICTHPNELGYIDVSNTFYDWISKNKPEYVFNKNIINPIKIRC